MGSNGSFSTARLARARNTGLTGTWLDVTAAATIGVVVARIHVVVTGIIARIVTRIGETISGSVGVGKTVSGYSGVSEQRIVRSSVRVVWAIRRVIRIVQRIARGDRFEGNDSRRDRVAGVSVT